MDIKNRSAEDIVLGAIEKEIRLLQRRVNKLKQESDHAVMAPIDVYKLGLEIAEMLSSGQKTDIKTLNALIARREKLIKLSKKPYSVLMDKQIGAELELEDLQREYGYLKFRYRGFNDEMAED